MRSSTFPWTGVRARGWHAPLIVSVAVVLLLLLSGGYAPRSSGTMGAYNAHSYPTVAASAVGSAIASLSGGTGPRGMGPLVCTPTGLGSANCGAAAAQLSRLGPGVTPVAATWLSLSPSLSVSPPHLASAMMAYDPVDGYVVLFGGSNATTSYLSYTWTYAHGQWTLLNPATSPPGRWISDFTWDAADQYLLLFGGADATGILNDTWSFVGGTWTSVSPTNGTAPGVRYRSQMTYDAGDGYVLLFSGTAAGVTTPSPFADTWKYKAGTWTNITKNVSGAPPGTFRAAMAYDPVDDYVVLFGGCTASACPVSTTWTYYNLTWKQLSPTSHPNGRVYPQMTWDPVQDYLLLFGGAATTAGGAMKDTWAFIGGNWTNLSSGITTQPVVRGLGMIAFDSADGYAVLFGGESPTTTYYNDTWSYGPAILLSVRLAPPVVDVGENATITLSAIASSVLSYNYTGLPAPCTTSNVSVFVCAPGASGRYNVTIFVNSSAGGGVVANTTLTVNPDPVLSGFVVTPSAVTVGVTANFTATVSLGTAPYGYRYSTLPAPCATVNASTLSCVPGRTSGGTYTVGLNVTDAAGFRVHSTVSLRVNADPTVTSFTVSPSTTDVGQWLNFSVLSGMGTPPLSYAYLNLPAPCLSQNLSSLACRPNFVTSGTAEVVVTDRFGRAAFNNTTYFVNADPAISAFAVSSSVIDSGSSLTFYVNASPGTGALRYELRNLPAGCLLTPGPQASCTPTATGTFTVTAVVIDAVGGSAEANQSITINALPTIAAFTATPEVSDVGYMVTFNVSLVAGTGTLPFGYQYAGLPSGCASVNKAVLTCAPTSAGTPTVVVTVTDHFGKSISQSAPITVNADPKILYFNPASTSLSLGQSVALSTAVSQGTGAYTFSYSGLPPGCASANVSSLACTPTKIGSYAIELTVMDTLGVAAHAQSFLNVTTPPSSGGGPSLLGLSGTSAIALLAIVVVVIAAVVGAVLWARRRRAGGGAATEPTVPPPPSEGAQSAAEPVEEDWVESP